MILHRWRPYCPRPRPSLCPLPLQLPCICPSSLLVSPASNCCCCRSHVAPPCSCRLGDEGCDWLLRSAGDIHASDSLHAAAASLQFFQSFSTETEAFSVFPSSAVATVTLMYRIKPCSLKASCSVLFVVSAATTEDSY